MTHEDETFDREKLRDHLVKALAEADKCDPSIAAYVAAALNRTDEVFPLN